MSAIWLFISGGFSKIVDIFLKHWKIIVPILLVIAAIWYHTHAVDKAFDDGIIAEQEANQARVDEENLKNRQFEQALDRAIQKYGAEIAQETATRTALEFKAGQRIETIIRDNPVYEQCLVDQEVINAQNEIRALGPGRR